MGLEASRLELDSIKEAVGQLASGNVFAEPNNEASAAEIKVEQETLQKPTVEIEASETDTAEAQKTTVQCAEDSLSTEPTTEAKEKQEA
jgi:hypothetical protein